MKTAWLVATSLILSLLTLVPAGSAHGCAAPDPEPICDDSCPDGEFHDHRFANSPENDCSSEGPCVNPGCNTIEGLCEDFPALDRILCTPIEIRCVVLGECRGEAEPNPIEQKVEEVKDLLP